jgi:CRP-like cAMP-binding protein
MSAPFLKKLQLAGGPWQALTSTDHELLLAVSETEQKTYLGRRDIIRESENPEHVLMMLEGWAARYKILPDGGRQITAFLLPGDFCDAHITMFERMDHSIATLAPSKVAMIPRLAMMELLDRPAIAQALWWASLVDEAILRSWIVSLGRRDAYGRLGHLLCELDHRLTDVGLASDGSFMLPLTQDDLADAMGLTSVHVNRTLRRFRDNGLVTFDHQHIVTIDAPRLQQAVGFDPNYLHVAAARPKPKLVVPT